MSAPRQLTILFAALLVFACGDGQAQQPPLSAAPAPDPKVLKQMEQILAHKFSRDPSEILQSLERTGAADPASLNAHDRFTHYFRTGEWRKLRDELAQMPPDLGRKIYAKMLGDLTDGRKPNLRLDDALGLADAVPGELTNENVRKLGQVLGLAVPAGETYWLAERLTKGSETLGSKDPAQRLLTGRVLLAGGFKELARIFLPPPEQVQNIADEGVRNEISAFLATQENNESLQREQIQRSWSESLAGLLDASPKRNDWDRLKASQALAKIIAQVPASTIAPVVSDLVKNQPDAAVRLIGAVGRKVQSELKGEVTARTENLQVQHTLAGVVAEQTQPGVQPWSQLLELLAETWLGEAETTFAQKANPPQGQQRRFLPPEELLSLAPAGKWFAALGADTRNRIDASVSRVILSAANFEEAADRIVEIGKRNPAAGVALAEDFLSAWGRAHNPQIPEPLRKKYDLPDDARIPVTPIILEKNIESLARMMALFRKASVAPKDYAKVVGAFDLAYGDAETYRTGHIEKVFGPLQQMDEPLFFLLLSRMNLNLGERWRKLEVQKTGLTRRDEAQTLELVRGGYATALQMIDAWLAGHPGSARALTLAGSLLTEWGDFEYFQELVRSEARKRMLGYKEKNLQAQEYFSRGAEAYAKEVPKLAPADYSVDAYLAWFHGLLGIGSNGQVNLSKAMNRAALAHIREHLLALPGQAGPAHLSRFARVVNARLNDEKEPLHEDLKYRYLASALVITKDDPFTLGAQKKVAYFDELLSELRLQTRVDGPNTIGRDQDFGIVLSIVHTEVMGRVAKFGQYLSNDSSIATGRPRKKTPLARKMREAQGPRDELELSLTEALAPFFEIKSITFATPDIRPRPTAKPGWEETVLAYLQVRVKDASVDKIPPVGMELKFIDLTGPITIPAESAETLIQVSTQGAPARPANQIELTQTLDTRQLFINGSLPLEIKATATGLVPDLEELLDLDGVKKAVGVRQVNAHEGLQVKELNTWGDQIAPRSERLWTVSLDGNAVREAKAGVEFRFPALKRKDAAATYQTYNDMNLTPLVKPVLQIRRGGADGQGAVANRRGPLFLGSAALLVVLAGGAWLLWRRGHPGKERGPQLAALFHLPAEIDGFAVAALLRRLSRSPAVVLRPKQTREIQSDLGRVEKACFGSNGGTMSEPELRTVAEKWLRLAA